MPPEKITTLHFGWRSRKLAGSGAVTIGSSRQCDLRIRDRRLAPLHATVTDAGDGSLAVFNHSFFPIEPRQEALGTELRLHLTKPDREGELFLTVRFDGRHYVRVAAPPSEATATVPTILRKSCPAVEPAAIPPDPITRYLKNTAKGRIRYYLLMAAGNVIEAGAALLACAGQIAEGLAINGILAACVISLFLSRAIKASHKLRAYIFSLELRPLTPDKIYRQILGRKERDSAEVLAALALTAPRKAEIVRRRLGLN